MLIYTNFHGVDITNVGTKMSKRGVNADMIGHPKRDDN